MISIMRKLGKFMKEKRDIKLLSYVRPLFQGCHTQRVLAVVAVQFHKIYEISEGSVQEIVDKNIDSFHNQELLMSHLPGSVECDTGKYSCNPISEGT